MKNSRLSGRVLIGVIIMVTACAVVVDLRYEHRR